MSSIPPPQQSSASPDVVDADEDRDEHADQEDAAGYSGLATLLVEGQERPVEVVLRGTFQPIDGLFHWYGRIAGDPELVTLCGGKRVSARIRTPQGEAQGELSDPDLWHRYRITGTSTPPFRVAGPYDPPSVT
ncbi:DUF4873 domain-containing protein [Streptomyces zagrosensis]|uniref:DUF4873 domain-containing protein n=1 Tax=Streptomyces zagrosensis TaxID=1042984 RepID=A0A7W9V0M0_9ACTN|nr:DUF4873 domain-containing protein [Streptomyces zagrosensis]MBB5938328.1 hypothetical protein [Streptomyces zagrosensis]